MLGRKWIVCVEKRWQASCSSNRLELWIDIRDLIIESLELLRKDCLVSAWSLWAWTISAWVDLSWQLSSITTVITSETFTSVSCDIFLAASTFLFLISPIYLRDASRIVWCWSRSTSLILSVLSLSCLNVLIWNPTVEVLNFIIPESDVWIEMSGIVATLVWKLLLLWQVICTCSIELSVIVLHVSWFFIVFQGSHTVLHTWKLSCRLALCMRIFTSIRAFKICIDILSAITSSWTRQNMLSLIWILICISQIKSHFVCLTCTLHRKHLLFIHVVLNMMVWWH